MSLLDDVLASTEKRGPGWIKDALAKATELAQENLRNRELQTTIAGIRILKGVAPELSRLTHAGLISVITRYYTGDERGAELEYLASGGDSLTELLDRSYRETAVTISDRARSDKDWKAVKGAFVEMGRLAIRVLPFLIAAA
jgi:hypothetical protein